MVLPRLETPRTPRVKSLGPEAVAWINESGINGSPLLPWQEYAITRALELNRDGTLRWKTIIWTVARQSGKSWAVRALAWWRIHQSERFGEPQMILHMAQMIDTAVEVWTPAATHAVEIYGAKAAKWGKGAEEIVLPDRAGRWKVQASSNRAAVGFSLTSAIVDEAWAVDAGIVHNGVEPAMLARREAQLYLVSTAGEASSTLLKDYRAQALADKDGTGDVLLVEWSSPPDAPYDEPATWKWASPWWTKQREQFLTSKLASIPEARFKAQYCNQWQQAINGWIPRSLWTATSSSAEPVGRPDVIAVEASAGHERWAAVAAWSVDGVITVRTRASISPADVWAWVEAHRPRRLLIGPSVAATYNRRARFEVVTGTDANRLFDSVNRLIHDHRLAHHPDDGDLTDAVGFAVPAVSNHGMYLSVLKSTGPVEAAQALVMAAGTLLAPGATRPSVRSA
jgi:hypothetical protein